MKSKSPGFLTAMACLALAFTVASPVGAQGVGADPRVAGLLEAARTGRIDEVTRLLDSGVSPSAAGPGGITALHLAAGSDRIEIVELLLARGADPAARDGTNMLALHHAAAGRSPGATERLLDAGTEVNAVGFTSGDGVADSTALILAAEMGAVEVVELLIARGANVNHVNNFQRTALFWARKAGKADVARILESHGAVADPEEARRIGDPRSTSATTDPDEGEEPPPGTDSPASDLTPTGPIDASPTSVPLGQEGSGAAREDHPAKPPPPLDAPPPDAHRVSSVIQALRTHLRERPDDRRTLLKLGILCRKAGALEPSRRYLEKLVQLAPRSAQAHAQLFLTYRAQGRVREARRQRELVRRLDPATEKKLDGAR